MLSIAFALATAIVPAAPAHLSQNETVRSMAELRVSGDGLRMRRPLTLAIEGSHHGLAGVGLNVWFQATPHIALDVGAGASSAVAKVGARVRYNFLTDEFTPFVAAGFSLGTGSFGKVLEKEDEILTARYSIGLSPYAQALAGVAFQGKSGFSCMAGLGWSHLLARHNFAWQAAPLPKQRKALPAAVDSGLLASVAVGYAL